MSKVQHITFQATVTNDQNAPGGNHVLRIELYRPDGTLAEHYCKNVTAPAAVYTGSIPLALNETPGIWQLKAIDVISKKETVTPLRIIPHDATQKDQ